MKKSGLHSFRIIIFFLGLIIIFLAGVLFHNQDNEIVWQEIYIMVSVIITYIVFFIPAILPIGDEDKSGGIFVAGAVYYRGAVGYLISSLGIIFLVTKMHIMWPYAIVSQSIALFIFVIYVYFACAVSSQVSNVAKAESNKRYGVDQLRIVANKLAVKADRLDIENQDIKKRIINICEDMRYLSPSDNRKAIKLEDELLERLKNLATDSIFTDSDNLGIRTIKNTLTEIEDIIKERKGIY